MTLNIIRSRSIQRAALLAVLVLVVAACASTSTYTQAKFATREEAIKALADTVGTGDIARADAILGEGAIEMISSGDAVADREDAEKVKAMILEGVEFVDEDGESIAYIGKDRWPFTIPLVQDADGWRFDVEAGRDELLTRRVGRNEIVTLATMRALVDAQREYAAVGRDGKPPCFAAKLWSGPGLHDGLYWETAEGEPESPMGPLVAEAAEEGYTRSESGPKPYHGYCYRLLTEQGAHAPGGAKSYLDENGLLTKGFAVVAWPATYGNSGIMTFVVNQLGIVFERDLGEDTPETVKEMKAYDPDSEWYPSEDVSE